MPRKKLKNQAHKYAEKKRYFDFMKYGTDFANLLDLYDPDFKDTQKRFQENIDFVNHGQPLYGIQMTDGEMSDGFDPLIDEMNDSIKKLQKKVKEYSGDFKELFEAQLDTFNPVSGDRLSIWMEDPVLEGLLVMFGFGPVLVDSVREPVEMDDPGNPGQKRIFELEKPVIIPDNLRRRKEAMGQFGQLYTDVAVSLKNLMMLRYERQKAEADNKLGLDATYADRYASAMEDFTSKYDKLRNAHIEYHKRTDLTNEQKELNSFPGEHMKIFDNRLSEITSADPGFNNRNMMYSKVANLKGQAKAIRNGWSVEDARILGHIYYLKAYIEESIKDNRIDLNTAKNQEEKENARLKLSQLEEAQKEIAPIFDKYDNAVKPGFFVKRDALNTIKAFHEKYPDAIGTNDDMTNALHSLSDLCTDPFEFEGKTQIQQAEQIQKMLDDVTSFGRSSGNFDNLHKSVKLLVKMAKENPNMTKEQFEAYERQVKVVKENARIYLAGKNKEAEDYKNKNNGRKLTRKEYTCKRINAVSNLMDALDSHLAASATPEIAPEYAGTEAEILYQQHLKNIARQEAIVAEYGFDPKNPETFRKAEQKLGELTMLLANNNGKGGSDNGKYSDTMRAVRVASQKLDEFAKVGQPLTWPQIADFRRLVSDINASASTYLQGKTNINSDYAAGRVDAIRKVVDVSREILNHFMDLEIEEAEKAEEKAFGDRYKLLDSMDIDSVSNKETFYGKKYLNPEMRSGAKYGYNSLRSAALNIAVSRLLLEGHSLDDITDPQKLRQEKEAMFDVVMTHMKNGTKADQEWIAETIYKGREAIWNKQDELIGKVNLSDPNLLQNKTFCQMLSLSHVEFDIWQEMSRCKEEIVALAQKDHPELDTYDKFKGWWSERNPMDELKGAVTTIRAYSRASFEGDEQAFGQISRVLQNDIKRKVQLSHLIDMQKNHPEVPFREWNVGKQLGHSTLESICMSEITPQLKALQKDSALIRPLLPSIVRGELTKNMKADINMDTFETHMEGYPTVAEIQSMAQDAKKQADEARIAEENEAFLKKAEEAQKRLEGGKENYKHSAKKYFKDAAYATVAALYKGSGKKLPVDHKTGLKMNLEEYANSLVANTKTTFVNSLRVEGKHNEFISPVKVASRLKDEKFIKNMVDENNKIAERNIQEKNRKHMAGMMKNHVKKVGGKVVPQEQNAQPGSKSNANSEGLKMNGHS